MSSPTLLRARITAYVRERAEAVVARFFPGFRVPGFFVGHRVTFLLPTEISYLLLHLKKLGVDVVAGCRVEDAIAKLLRNIDGAATNTFYSFRVAESLAAFGPFEGNPVLRDYSPAERENLRLAVDSTSIYDPVKGDLRGFPNNYWAVLARCEWARREIGLLSDPTILDLALSRVGELLFKNARGFFDDSPDLDGRYDIYSADTHLFLEPLWPRLDAARLRDHLQAHVRLLEAIALENGAFIAWGRSIGALSVCMTAELGSTALRLGLASDPHRTVALVEHAFEQFQGWIEDDLIRAHRGPATEGYRGIYRLAQMTLDCLSKWCDVATQLAQAPDLPPPVDGGDLFPDTDVLLPLEDRRPAAVWMFRNRNLAFQLPVVSGTNADYVPTPRAPGLFENPVDSPLVCGVPRVAVGDAEYTCAGLPVSLEKTDGGLRLRYEGFPRAGSDALAGSRAVEYRVEGDAIVVSEEWNFAETPTALALLVPEGKRRLSLRLEGEDSAAASTSMVNVEGMSEWRSCWGPLRRLHQVDFAPARQVRFTWRVRPALRVTTVPGNHDYTRSLYEAMPPGEIDERPIRQDWCPWNDSSETIVGDGEIFHVGWPEHLFSAHGMTAEQLVARHEELLAWLQRARVRVLWTMHNRRPHAPFWRGEAGARLYRLWASAADGLIHHSEWGMQLMRAELPYKPDARHAVIAHGHFGKLMPPPAPRAELEHRFGLAPCALRFGVLGRPQPEKGTDLIVRAFKAAARADQQLVISAHPIATDVSDDRRITLLPREKSAWLTREEISAHLHLCDALVSAHTGDTYLTTGAIADAFAAGIPMLVNGWPFLREMYGDAAFCYDDTEAGLARLFAQIEAGDIVRGKQAVAALLPRFDWTPLARQTHDLLRAVVTPPPIRARALIARRELAAC